MQYTAVREAIILADQTLVLCFWVIETLCLSCVVLCALITAHLPMSRTHPLDGFPTVTLVPPHARSSLRLGHDSLKKSFFRKFMPNSRRFLPICANPSADEDVLPRVSQQQRLFSNLDRSMRHDKGSVFGATTLIAGTFSAETTVHIMGTPTSLHIAGPSTDMLHFPIKATLYRE